MLPAELSQQFQALVDARQIDQLLALLQEALRTYPDEPDVHHLLGWARTQQGRVDDAIAHFRETVRLKPDAIGTLTNLGTLLLEQERASESLMALHAALTQNPNYVPALTAMGLTLARVAHHEKALPFLLEAVRIDPNLADAHHYLSFSYMTLGQLADAERHLDIALRLRPETGAFLSTLGLLREKQRRIDEATALFQQAVESEPRMAEAWSNLGNIHAGVWGNMELALRCFEQALALKPQFSDARHHRGMVKLTLGDFAGGWTDYEARPSVRQKPSSRYSQPRWHGEPLAGKTILIHAEQGLGDTLHFIRYALPLKARGARVVAEVQKPLLPLLARMPGIDLLVPEGSDLPPHDFQIPLLSLPLLLGIEVAKTPYLLADPERIAFWKERLAAIPGRKIGIAWQGDPGFKYDWLRSIPLAQFAPLARLPATTLISLQKNVGVEQIAANRTTVSVTVLDPPIDTAAGPFMDTAAIMMHLDLVVTSDTALAHLAGGLGVPVWLALHLACDWRWQRDREHTPWYSTMRLFRQTKVGDWNEIFHRIASALQADAPTKIPLLSGEGGGAAAG